MAEIKKTIVKFFILKIIRNIMLLNHRTPAILIRSALT